MEWIVKFVRKGDKGDIILRSEQFPSRRKAAETLPNIPNIVRNQNTQTYIVYQ